MYPTWEFFVTWGGGVGGILSVPVVKIALSEASEYPFLNPGTLLQSNANGLLCFSLFS